MHPSNSSACAQRWRANMHNLRDIVEFTLDGKPQVGVVVGRTREEHPRYNIQVMREIHKDVPAEKVVRAVKEHACH